MDAPLSKNTFKKYERFDSWLKIILSLAKNLVIIVPRIQKGREWALLNSSKFKGNLNFRAHYGPTEKKKS